MAPSLFSSTTRHTESKSYLQTKIFRCVLAWMELEHLTSLGIEIPNCSKASASSSLLSTPSPDLSIDRKSWPRPIITLTLLELNFFLMMAVEIYTNVIFNSAHQRNKTSGSPTLNFSHHLPVLSFSSSISVERAIICRKTIVATALWILKITYTNCDQFAATENKVESPLTNSYSINIISADRPLTFFWYYLWCVVVSKSETTSFFPAEYRWRWCFFPSFVHFDVGNHLE